jgi:hypothetical protein
MNGWHRMEVAWFLKLSIRWWTDGPRAWSFGVRRTVLLYLVCVVHSCRRPAGYIIMDIGSRQPWCPWNMSWRACARRLRPSWQDHRPFRTVLESAILSWLLTLFMTILPLDRPEDWYVLRLATYSTCQWTTRLESVMNVLSLFFVHWFPTLTFFVL